MGDGAQRAEWRRGDAHKGIAGFQPLFERLLRRCEEQGWTHAFGMLTDQARMHQDIVAFPDREFYGGRLQPLYGWQSSAEPAFQPDAHDTLESLLATRRPVCAVV